MPAITGDPSVLLATPPPNGGWTPRLGRTVTVRQVTVRSSRYGHAAGPTGRWRCRRPAPVDVPCARRAPGPDRLAVRQCLFGCRNAGYRLDRTLTPPVTVRSSRGESVGTASSPQRSIPVGLLSGLGHPLPQKTSRGQDNGKQSSASKSIRTTRSDCIVPTTTSRFSALCPQSDGGRRGRFVGCSVGTEDKPAGGRSHTLTEQLPPPTS